ncbi:MAG: hypothetical protein WD139_12815, partial [Balneolaceae bacterium]
IRARGIYSLPFNPRLKPGAIHVPSLRDEWTKSVHQYRQEHTSERCSVYRKCDRPKAENLRPYIQKTSEFIGG